VNDITNIPANWPFWAVIVYLVVKDGLPLLARGANRMAAMVVPARMEERKRRQEAQQNQAGRDADLQERAVIVQETLAKNTIILTERVSVLEKDHQQIIAGLTAANQSLAVMLDRTAPHRQSQSHKE
jgi:hypothetical protein